MANTPKAVPKKKILGKNSRGKSDDKQDKTGTAWIRVARAKYTSRAVNNNPAMSIVLGIDIKQRLMRRVATGVARTWLVIG